jgi:uncharacterized membrane protein YfcA
LKISKNFLKRFLLGGVVGSVNGLLGAGGGILCVPILVNQGFERKSAHKNAVAVILPITLVSAISYLVQGHVTLADSIKYIPGGVLGAAVGTFFMSKISVKWLKRIFGVFMVWAGWRLLF